MLETLQTITSIVVVIAVVTTIMRKIHEAQTKNKKLQKDLKTVDERIQNYETQD